LWEDPELTDYTSSKFAPVPFEFSIEQGFILGVPLFWGLRKLKKMRRYTPAPKSRISQGSRRKTSI